MSGNRLRVLYLQPAPLFGGAERQAASTASLLPEFGIDVVPMVGPGRVIVDWLRERGVREIVHSENFPGGWPKQKGIRRLTLPGRYLACGLRARAEIAQIVGAQRIDAIFASLPFAWITGWTVARPLNLPIVWRAGGARINLIQKLALFALTRFVRPDRLVCNAPAVKRTFAPLVPAPAIVLVNGVDSSVFHPGAGDARRYRPQQARWVIGYAGRLARSKRPADFIRMAVLLKARYPDAHFLLAGEGSRRRELERLAREWGADNLSFLGFVSDMPSFYAACDVVVLPSRAEGCPNFLLEAMSMAKPIVAADVAPVIELVGSHENALLYRYGDVHALAESVSTLLERPELRTSYALRGHAHAKTLGARSNAAKLAQLLEVLVAEKRPSHDANQTLSEQRDDQPRDFAAWHG